MVTAGELKKLSQIEFKNYESMLLNTHTATYFQL